LSIDARPRTAVRTLRSTPQNQLAVRLILDGFVHLRALRRFGGLSCLYVLSSFQRTGLGPSRGNPDPGCSLHPIRRGPKSRREPIFGEPYELIKTSQAVSIALSAAIATFGDGCSLGNSFAEPGWSCFPCVQLGGPEPGLLGDERRKRKSMIRAEGGLVNPYRSSLLEGHSATLSGDPEPRRDRTRSLPHIRQVNAHVMEPV
jgi:hypothetical protein